MSATVLSIATMPAATTIDRLKELVRRNIEPAEYNHYIRNSEITRSLVKGVEVIALCGAIVRADSFGRGSTSSGSLGTCPECAMFHAMLIQPSR